MTKTLTLSEIENLLTETTIAVTSNWNKEEYEEELNWYWWAWENSEEGTPVQGLGVVFTIDRVGGQGQGDYAHVVVKVVTEDGVRYFKKQGWHASHDGTYYDGDFSEVTPQQKVVTVYE